MSTLNGRRLAFIGPPGSGKTSLARAVAEIMGATAADTDEIAQARIGSISEYMARCGEPAFRRAEHDALISAISSGAEIISCGGGIVLDKQGMNALRTHCDIVLLRADEDTLRSRIEHSDRPLKSKLHELLAAREPLYARYADYTAVTDCTVQEAVLRVLRAVDKPRGNRYDVLLCDADDTVLDFQAAMRYSLLTAAHALGVNADDDFLVDTYRTCNDALWAKLERGEITRDELTAARFKIFAERAGLDIDPEKMNGAYTQAMCATRFVIDGAREFLQAVRRRGIKAYIITNSFTRFASQRLKALDGCIDGAFISEEVGFAKPDKRFFDGVTAALGITDKSRTLVFGDGVNSDILGGINSGLDICHYARGGGCGCGAGYHVRSYGELLKIL